MRSDVTLRPHRREVASVPGRWRRRRQRRSRRALRRGRSAASRRARGCRGRCRRRSGRAGRSGCWSSLPRPLRRHVHADDRQRRGLGDGLRSRPRSSRSSPATRRVFHAGEGNQILRPILGDNSVLVLDEKPHIGQRKLLLPPFHGERMQGYGEMMARSPAREIERWPTGTPYTLRPRMQAITLEIILETVFGVHDRARMDAAAGGAARLPRPHHDPRLLLPVILHRPRADPPHSRFPPARRPRRRADPRGDRRAPRRRATWPSETTSSRCWSPPATTTAAR